MIHSLRIATRNSPLALWQAEFVRLKLNELYPNIRVELVGMTTKGDQILDRSLAKVGGKGLFIKELEHALLNGQADIAVHSMKDVTVDFPEGLGLSTIMARHDPRDALVSNDYASFESLPQGAKVGTSSLRRQTQLNAKRPDLTWVDLRGNVNTRLAKLDQGDYQAIILATAGLERLGFADRIRQKLSVKDSLPAPGQGAIGIECRLADQEILQLLAPLHDTVSAQCVLAEREVNRHLAGGCQVPIAAYAVINGDELVLDALVAEIDGSRILKSHGSARLDGSDNDELVIKQLSRSVAQELQQQGATQIIDRVYAQQDSMDR